MIRAISIKLKKIEKAREEYKSIVELEIRKIQGECTHPKDQCVEGKSTRETWTIGSGFPPFTVCKRCGYAECQWYGPNILPHFDIPVLSRDVALKLVVGGVKSNV